MHRQPRAGKEVIDMALNRLPAIKPSKGAVFFMGAFLATFIFWFTRPETEVQPTGEHQSKQP